MAEPVQATAAASRRYTTASPPMRRNRQPTVAPPSRRLTTTSLRSGATRSRQTNRCLRRPRHQWPHRLTKPVETPSRRFHAVTPNYRRTMRHITDEQPHKEPASLETGSFGRGPVAGSGNCRQWRRGEARREVLRSRTMSPPGSESDTGGRKECSSIQILSKSGNSSIPEFCHEFTSLKFTFLVYAVEGKKRSAAGISAGIACSVVLILVLSVFAFLRFKRRIKATEDDCPLKKIAGGQCMIFDLPALQEATENFSEENKLGKGGFGIIYKNLLQGILPDGQGIAVKKLLGRTGHGLRQLHNEVLVLAELQHKNLVRLQGFCLHQDDTLLVYEYIKNGSLNNFLFVDNSDHGNTLNWGQQYNIILGIAKGILYLHEDSGMRIIHRDLKPNNILLDEDMDPKIADFGLARLLGEGHTHKKTARAVGTPGYMAPEYAIHGCVSSKIDIFSFGVLVLEIVTRRRNCSSDDHDVVNLLSDVWNYWTKGTISEMIDQSLHEYARSQALRCIHIGLLCIQSDPDDRPSISSVIFMLTRGNMEIQAPAQPAFSFGRESNLASSSFE